MATISYSDRPHYIENSTDPRKPNYRPSSWQRPLERWAVTQDWYGDIWDVDILGKYLIQKPGEFHQDFKNRVRECCPDSRFRRAVEDNAAMLNQFEIAPQTFAGFEGAADDIDLGGRSLKSWDFEMMQRFFRDGIVAVVVDQVSRPTGESRPSLTWVSVSDLYAPSYITLNGVPTLARLSIRRDTEELVSTSSGGEMQLVTRYYEYKLVAVDGADNPVGCSVTVWQEQKGTQRVEFIEEQTVMITGADGQPLFRLPIEILSVTHSLEFTKEDDPISPLFALLKEVIKFTNHESQNDSFEGKVMVPTINEYLEHGEIENPQPLYSGPSRTNIRGVNDRIEVMEPRGSSAKLVYEHQDRRDAQISQLDNQFFHLRGGPVTATEAAIENLKSKVKVPALIEKKESLYQELVKIWRSFSDPGYNGFDDSGGILVSEKALQMPFNPEDVRNTFEGVTLGIISPRVALQRLARIGWLEPEELEVAAPQTPDLEEVLG